MSGTYNNKKFTVGRLKNQLSDIGMKKKIKVLREAL
jgi:hypothetical protein